MAMLTPVNLRYLGTGSDVKISGPANDVMLDRPNRRRHRGRDRGRKELMSVELNHTVVPARDKHAAARFLADILSVPVQPEFGPFVPVRLANGVTLDYMDRSGEIDSNHYAFLVGDAEFDAAFERITAAGVQYWADPGHQRPEEINTRSGGRGLYFNDPNGHNMEILTRALD
jgi:hypothetical protein